MSDWGEWFNKLIEKIGPDIQKFLSESRPKKNRYRRFLRRYRPEGIKGIFIDPGHICEKYEKGDHQ